MGRGFELKNDPNVAIFDFMPDVKLELNVQTNQYGRTFQDRSHVFRITGQQTDENNVYDLSISGKRGNSVQVYPSVAYSFTPRDLFIGKNDKINLHWTGSQTNNRRNDGRGKEKHDLHSITTHNGTQCIIDSEITPSTSFQQLIENPETCSLIGWQHYWNGLPMVNRIHTITSSKLNTNSDSSAALTMDHDEINFIRNQSKYIRISIFLRKWVSKSF